MTRALRLAILLACLLASGSPVQASSSQGQKPGDPWISVPAQEGAPAFRYQIQPGRLGFHLRVLPPKDLDRTRWALQLWVGDPHMVALRQKHIAELKENIKSFRELAKDKDHAEADCQERLGSSIAQAEEVLGHFRAYDPFGQFLLFFGKCPVPDIKGLELATLDAEPGKDDPPSFDFSFNHSFDVAELQLNELSYGLALVPASDPRPRPLKHPLRLFLNAPWPLSDQQPVDQPTLKKLYGSPLRECVYLARPEGLVLAEPQELGGPPCYGAEGNFGVWDLWVAVVAQELDLPPGSGLHITLLGTQLAVREGDRKEPEIIYLGPNIASGGDQSYELLHSASVDKVTYLLLRVTGPSRPGSPSSYCGAGEETELIWLRFWRDGSLSGLNSARIESCFENIEVNPQPDTSTGSAPWVWKYEFRSGDSDRYLLREIVYDPRHPESGLVITDAPTPQEN